MRVLHVVPSINPVTGGTVTATLLQTSGLARLGHEVELFTTRWPAFEKDKSTFERDGVRVHVFPASTSWPLGHVPYSRDLVAAVRDACGRFDIYHAHSLWNPLITQATALFRAAGLPYAITCHGMLDPVVLARNRLVKRAWAALWERRNVEAAALVHFTSEEEMRKAQGQGWRLPRSLVMRVDVDPSAFAHLPPRAHVERTFPQLRGKEVIAFVGRINWVKNLDLLVAALAEVRKQMPNAVLLCAGPDGDGHRHALERQAHELGIAEHVVFTGLLEGDALKAVYARADVVALVSRKENFGLAAAEALSAGVPVVLSDGVDMGQHWVAPPVWRVAQNASAIARGLIAALVYAKETGLPCVSARELAGKEWGTSATWRLSEAYESILAARPCVGAC